MPTRTILSTTSWLTTTLLIFQTLIHPSLSNPLTRRAGVALNPVIGTNFPDPSVTLDTDGTLYAFSTSNGQYHVPAASAPGYGGPWTRITKDMLPTVGNWSTGQDIWAPDVHLINGNYVLYYTGGAKVGGHCIGTATASSILGPYTPAEDALACNTDQGGSIDPSGFQDPQTGTRYVVYKIDGNSIGHGNGPCGNSEAPFVPTPLMLQELDSTGTSAVGSPVQLLDRGTDDGPLIEAPSLVFVNNVYILFFSSNCYSTPLYDVSYAYSDNLEGPYTKSSEPLMVTNDPFAITAPGGATVSLDATSLVFHANCDDGRCMFERPIAVDGTTVTVNTVDGL